MKKADVQVGMYVTCIQSEECYYSNYGGRPEMLFRPGMVALVASVDVPAVTKNYAFICADFYAPTENPKWESNDVWRVALKYDNIKIVPAPENTRQVVSWLGNLPVYRSA